MAKSVLISIRPEWVEKIVSGEKTVEIRKSRPNLKTPFKCYIYQTKGKRGNIHVAGAVIGEFMCNGINCRTSDCLIVKEDTEYALAGSCLSSDDLRKYLFGKRFGEGPIPLYSIPDFYRWSISKVRIYDTPKELPEFPKIHRDCWYADLGLAKRDCPECRNKDCYIHRPPQSWCYVEEFENE